MLQPQPVVHGGPRLPMHRTASGWCWRTATWRAAGCRSSSASWSAASPPRRRARRCCSDSEEVRLGLCCFSSACSRVQLTRPARHSGSPCFLLRCFVPAHRARPVGRRRPRRRGRGRLLIFALHCAARRLPAVADVDAQHGLPARHPAEQHQGHQRGPQGCVPRGALPLSLPCLGLPCRPLDCMSGGERLSLCVCPLYARNCRRSFVRLLLSREQVLPRT